MLHNLNEYDQHVTQECEDLEHALAACDDNVRDAIGQAFIHAGMSDMHDGPLTQTVMNTGGLAVNADDCTAGDIAQALARMDEQELQCFIVRCAEYRDTDAVQQRYHTSNTRLQTAYVWASLLALADAISARERATTRMLEDMHIGGPAEIVED